MLRMNFIFILDFIFCYIPRNKDTLGIEKKYRDFVSFISNTLQHIYSIFVMTMIMFILYFNKVPTDLFQTGIIVL